ncbi:MAG TPA: serine hydrolase domain-containing protein [Sphingomicrobium sp.]
MSRRTARLYRKVIVCTLLASLAAQPRIVLAQTRLPETIAGKQLNGFLDALNSGDRAALKAFLAAHFTAPPNDPGFVDHMTDENFKIYRLTKGIEVENVVDSSPAAIKVRVMAKSTGLWSEVTLFTTAAPPDYTRPAAPYQIVGLGFSDIAAPSQTTRGPALSERQIHDRLTNLMERLTAADAFSGTVYVARYGRPIYAKAFGFANKGWAIPNRVDTKFNLASVTKMFTAVAIAQLVEHGKLSYDETVGKVLPDYPNKVVARSVTIGQLLSHTSGLIGGRTLAEKTPDPQSARTLAPWLNTFVNEPLSFAPGQRFDYSNAGYILLGAIIEKASGQSYYEYVRDHVFEPANMTNTGFFELDLDTPNLASGFMDWPDGSRRDNIFALTVKGAPHEGAYSTGADMTAFYMALMNHVLLGDASLKALWSGITEDADKHREYGYGAYIERYNGRQIISHGGGWQGITNQVEFYPDLGYSVVILSNIDDDPTAIAYKLREWLTQSPSNAAPRTEPTPILRTAVSVADNDAVGLPTAVSITVTNTGGTFHAGIIDLEVTDAKGNKVDQQVTEGQKLANGQTRQYTYRWIPAAAGKYTLNVGLFGPGWTPKYRFDTGLAAVTVN